MPSGSSTDRILNGERLKRLPAHAWVYNFGRGNAIDEDALAKALEEGIVAGAGLDVFAQEPLAVDSPLRHAPNILLMPHSSAFSPNYMDLFVKEFVARFQKRFDMAPQ